MKNISNQLASLLSRAGIFAGAWATTAAYAVNDLPGGPAVNQLNLHPAATKIAEEQAWLHWFMLIICTVIFVVVFGVMFYSIWKHRRSVGHKPATFHESVKVEIAWTIVPFVIVILMALPATKAVVASKDTSNADLTIKATGYQWKWATTTSKARVRALVLFPPWTTSIAKCPTMVPRALTLTTIC